MTKVKILTKSGVGSSIGLQSKKKCCPDPFFDVPYEDPLLLNSTGIAFQPETSTKKNGVWVSNTKSGKVTLYTLKGKSQDVVLTVPKASYSPIGALGTPTGIYRNVSAEFKITNGSITPIAAELICVTMDGTICGYHPLVNATHFVTISEYEGSSFRDMTSDNTYLYITDALVLTTPILKIDDHFNVVTPTGQFTGPILELINIYRPNGIDLIDGTLFVSYIYLNPITLESDQPPTSIQGTKGPGFGVIDEYTKEGVLLRRVVNSLNGLNVPYGIGRYSCYYPFDEIFVGNSGSGELNVYNFFNGELVKTLSNSCGDEIRLLDIHKMIPIMDNGRVRIYFVGGNNEYGYMGYLTK